MLLLIIKQIGNFSQIFKSKNILIQWHYWVQISLTIFQRTYVNKMCLALKKCSKTQGDNTRTVIYSIITNFHYLFIKICFNRTSSRIVFRMQWFLYRCAYRYQLNYRIYNGGPPPRWKVCSYYFFVQSY